MQPLNLTAEKRTLLGRKVKKLRQEGIVPANVFGKKIKNSLAIQVKAKDFQNVFEKAGETSIIELVLEKQKIPVLVANVQKHSVTGQLLHIDFRQVDLKEKILAHVPLHLTGESPAEKQGLGIIVQLIDEVEVEALPQDLPEKFVIDISSLTEVDQTITVKDIKTDSEKVVIKNDPDQIVVQVQEQAKEQETQAAEAPSEEQPEQGEPSTQEQSSQPAQDSQEAQQEPSSEVSNPQN